MPSSPESTSTEYSGYATLKTSDTTGPIAIRWGFCPGYNGSKSYTFGSSFSSYTPVVLTCCCTSGDPGTQRYYPSSISNTGFTLGSRNNADQRVMYVAISGD